MRIVLDLQVRQSRGSYYRGIGRYALAFSRALAQQPGHEVHLVVNAAFPPFIQEIRQDFQDCVPPEHIHTFTIPTPAAGLFSDNAWRVRAAEQVRENFLANLRPDIVHVSSLFEGMGDSVVTSVMHPALMHKTSITLHDLIPLVTPDQYWLEPVRRDWYYRKLQSLKNAGLFLAVSDYSRQEAIERLALEPESVVTVPNAVTERFNPQPLPLPQQQALLEKFGIRQPFILYAGGAETRKNVDRLVEAYARLPAALKQQYQFVVAGELQLWQREHLSRLFRKHGLTPALAVLTDVLGDDELIGLYKLASLFVFPSLYEGFGLPVLEAMACGVPTIAANNSSLPEVVGWVEATFDALDVDAIRNKMQQCLTDDGFRATLLQRAQQQVRQFSWEASARRAVDAFAQLHERNQSRLCCTVAFSGQQRMKLALVADLQADVVQAHQCLALLPGLARYYDIEVVSDRERPNSAWVQANFPQRSRQWMRDNPHYYQRRLYAANAAHADGQLIRLLREQPGTLWLDSLFLPGLQASAEMQYLSHGYHALLAANNAETAPYPANKLLLDNALGVMVTEPALQTQAQGWYGADYAADWWRVFTVATTDKALGVGESDAGYCYRLLEQFHQEHPLGREQQLLEDVQHLYVPVPPSEQDWMLFARSLADNRPAWMAGQPTLFYDLSIYVRENNATGVHRVTIRILEELFRNPPAGYRVEPIYADAGHYRYARKLTHELLGLEPTTLPDAVVDFHKGDKFLIVDLGLHIAVEMEEELHYIKAKGVEIHYLVHDILAVKLPREFFHEGIYHFFPRWLNVIGKVADGLICTTRTGQAELETWMAENPPVRHDPLRFGHCTLGADLRQPAVEESVTAEQQALLDRFRIIPTILMVSTIEPRKGYGQALNAFERLWAKGVNVNLVLVGKHGWNVDALIGRIQNHPEQGKHLHWMKFVSDAMLMRLYANCSALLMASEGEGFGLPLIEAAQHHLPIIARGLPVFREIAGEHAFYFDGLEPQALADAVEQWLALAAQGKTPQPQGMTWATWRESAEQIKAFLFGAQVS